MRERRRFIVTCLLASSVVATLSGCSAQLKVKVPSAEGLADRELAILRRDPDDRLQNGFYSVIHGLTDLQRRDVVIRSEGFKDYWEVKVPPGNYQVMLKTYGVNTTPAFPWVGLTVEAGKSYYFRGVPIMDKSAVRAEYRVEPTRFDELGVALPARPIKP